jgi:LmbE family N-acetylglucosaminyl deacetylase
VGRQLGDALRQLGADVLVTHGSNGEYGHPAHQTCHQAAQLALDSFAVKQRPLFYTFAPFFESHPYPRLTNKDDAAHLVLDITPVLASKSAATLCHRTQHDLFVRKRSEHAGRTLTVEEVVIQVESLHRARSGAAGKQAAFERLLAPYALSGAKSA